MIVVSDTSPINYLVLIGQTELLPRLLGEVIIPDAVFRELNAQRTPKKVVEFLRDMPEWLSIMSASLLIDQELEELGTGEREAILLAEELGADALLMDDLAGRLAAERRGVAIIGTVGFLERAADKGLLELDASLGALKTLGFFLSPQLERALIEKRKNRTPNG